MKTKIVSSKDIASNPNLSLRAEDYVKKSYAEMSNKEKIEELEAALIDVLDGNSAWHEIQKATGCSDERCQEISTLYDDVEKEYTIRHKLNG